MIPSKSLCGVTANHQKWSLPQHHTIFVYTHRDHRDDVKLFKSSGSFTAKFWTFWYHFYDQFKECKQWKFVVKSFFKIIEIYWPLIFQIQCKWGGLINMSFIVSFRPPRHFFLHFFFGIFLLLIVIVWQINKYKYKCVHDRDKIPSFLVPLNSYTHVCKCEEIIKQIKSE